MGRPRSKAADHECPGNSHDGSDRLHGEVSHPTMPTHALLGDHVEFSVLLDDMGGLLNRLVNR
ncbi:MAG: hypothetical protein EOO38_15120 [Cytophagaceae bacterium]|nr:MAG: hypothetical protein EOO38_15120 [Cytophagaceae bacterium]